MKAKSYLLETKELFILGIRDELIVIYRNSNSILLLELGNNNIHHD